MWFDEKTVGNAIDSNNAIDLDNIGKDKDNLMRKT
jgi:hypothetical protein